MTRKLTEIQKKKIEKLLKSNKRTPADETIGDSVKKYLRLSDKAYEELGNDIEDFLEKFFEKIVGKQPQPCSEFSYGEIIIMFKSEFSQKEIMDFLASQKLKGYCLPPMSDTMPCLVKVPVGTENEWILKLKNKSNITSVDHVPRRRLIQY